MIIVALPRRHLPNWAPAFAGEGENKGGGSAICAVERLDHGISRFRPQHEDAAVEMPRRVDAIGEQGPGEAALEIDPQAGAGEAGMADRLWRAGLAARPAGETPFPTAGAVLVEGRADRPEHRLGGAAAVEQA